MKIGLSKCGKKWPGIGVFLRSWRLSLLRGKKVVRKSRECSLLSRCQSVETEGLPDTYASCRHDPARASTKVLAQSDNDMHISRVVRAVSAHYHWHASVARVGHMFRLSSRRYSSQDYSRDESPCRSSLYRVRTRWIAPFVDLWLTISTKTFTAGSRQWLGVEQYVGRGREVPLDVRA